MRKWIALSALLTITAIGGTIAMSNGDAKADDAAKAKKVSIKDVMKAHKGKPSLLVKVRSGKASDADKKKLLELYTALTKTKPPKGDAAAWKKRTGALMLAAKAVVEGKKIGVKLLAKASNCKACHTAHKGK